MTAGPADGPNGRAVKVAIHLRPNGSEVTEGINGTAIMEANGKVANSNHVVFRTVKQFMTVWQQWRLEISVSRQLFNLC